MKTKKSIFCLLLAAFVALAAVSCQKEETPDPIVPIDTTPVPEEPEEPEVTNYMVLDGDTLVVHHCIITRYGAVENPQAMFSSYFCDHPELSLVIYLSGDHPNSERQYALVGIGHGGLSVETVQADILFDTVNGGYKVEIDCNYRGQQLEFHFEGPVSDPDVPAGHGTYRRAGFESDIIYNYCSIYEGEYNVIFQSHRFFADRDYYYFRIDMKQPLFPGTYSGDQLKLYRIVENSIQTFDWATDCTLDVSRQGDIWELHLTATIDNTELIFDYTGKMNFEYLN